jgi:hypothetical protein
VPAYPVRVRSADGLEIECCTSRRRVFRTGLCKVADALMPNWPDVSDVHGQVPEQHILQRKLRRFGTSEALAPFIECVMCPRVVCCRCMSRSFRLVDGAETGKV